MTKKGTLISYTTVYAVPEGFRPPVRLALVRLRDGSQILCEDRTANPEIDKKVLVKKDKHGRNYCID